MITMLLGGLWHGAAWTFVIWGGLHGLYLVAERALRERFGTWPVWMAPGTQWALSLLTFVLVSLSWIPFRAAHIEQVGVIARSLVVRFPSGAALGVSVAQQNLALAVMAGLLATHWLTRQHTLASTLLKTPSLLRVAGLALMLISVLMVRGNDQAFIYFQF
jgi:D-alanyl-lipoteichoic acid acyltransferase DltB (MBOAT superfamily)